MKNSSHDTNLIFIIVFQTVGETYSVSFRIEISESSSYGNSFRSWGGTTSHWILAWPGKRAHASEDGGVEDKAGIHQYRAVRSLAVTSGCGHMPYRACPCSLFLLSVLSVGTGGRELRCEPSIRLTSLSELLPKARRVHVICMYRGRGAACQDGFLIVFVTNENLAFIKMKYFKDMEVFDLTIPSITTDTWCIF